MNLPVLEGICRSPIGQFSRRQCAHADVLVRADVITSACARSRHVRSVKMAEMSGTAAGSETGPAGDSGPEPLTGTEFNTNPGTEQLHQNNPLLNLPIVAIDSILGLMSYDEISGLRMVCKRMDAVCQRMLNQGFLKVERYHSLCQKQVKAQLPR
ncbi:F-box only protein 28, partial [Rhincodon typus]|uniref:F-box only protein 28 n=1 Tax=Rhincodon typus TaxID=259920 RepID=UPI00202F4E31